MSFELQSFGNVNFGFSILIYMSFWFWELQNFRTLDLSWSLRLVASLDFRASQLLEL